MFLARCLVVSIVFLGIAQVANLSKPVSVTLHSKWPHTPLLLEASEFVFAEDSLLFWRFVEGIKHVQTGTTARAIYDSVLERAEQLLPPLMFNLLLLSLSLHTFSPTVAMFQQLADERRSSLQKVGMVECSPFLEMFGQMLCSEEEVTSALERKPDNYSEVQLFDFDHIYPASSPANHVPTAILYCELGTAKCGQFHERLVQLAVDGRLQYVFRHHFKPQANSGTQLSGYGVQLAVKSTEYKAVDDTAVKDGGSLKVGEEETEEEEGRKETDGFIFSTLKSLHPQLSEQLEDYHLHLLHSAREIPELKAWQLQDLGFQAAQRVTSAPPDVALSVLRDIVQNLPTVAKSLSRVAVSKELRSEVTHNQRQLRQYGMEEGDSVVLLNGIVLQLDSADVFSLLDILLSESRLLTGLTTLGISTGDVPALLQLSVHSQQKSFAVDMRSEAVVFINDLESDQQYTSWPKSMQQFLQPVFPGTLRQVAKNVFNLVFCYDPATAEGAELTEYIALFLDNLVPVRLGVLLVASSEQDGGEVGVALVRAFYYIVENHSPREAFNWLIEAHSEEIINSKDGVATFFSARYHEEVEVEEVLGENTLYEQHRKNAMEFFKAKGMISLPQALLNGVQLDLDEDLETVIVNQLQQQTYLVQQWTYRKRVSDSTDMYGYFMNRSNVLQRLNHHVTAMDCLHLDLSASPPDPVPSLLEFSSLSLRTMSALIADRMFYYTNAEDEFALRPISIWLAVDLSSEQGRQAAISGVMFVSAESTVRLGLIHNLASSGNLSFLARAVVAAELLGQSSVDLLLALLTAGMEGILEAASEVQGLDVSGLRDTMESEEVKEILAVHQTYCERVVGLSGGAMALLANGRVVGPLDSGEAFLEEDYRMLAQFENSSHATAVAKAVGAVGVEGVEADDDTAVFRSDLIMKVASLLRSQPKQRRIPPPTLAGSHSLVHLPPSEPLHHQLIAILNPLDAGLQKWAHLLKVLQVVTPFDIRIYLNPRSKLPELPIKSFYRYVLEPELAFQLDGSYAPGPLATFSDLPHSPLLTLHMDVPHSWLVESLRSPHDLDNIHLEDVESRVEAEFQLEHILVEGQCYDAGSGHPVPGLELVLGTPSQPEHYDTIVMANLGYFQLKASPGAWTLQIRKGRSDDIYTITRGVGATGTVGQMAVAVRSFSGVVEVVRVVKKKGMEEVRLLYDDKEEALEKEEKGGRSMWDTISSLIGGVREEEEEEVSGGARVPSNETINVFSIASGHLYERFLRIMMLSVLKHTRNPVKFWFLKNYLSPTFKDFIPYMARQYGFEYELVQYKWPRWLHQQTEKQRMIWGYKILFLDVLFPLSVKKIIFVDADQVVRADLKELLEAPLDGAPYGYTPFCSSRPEMEGFRFWERGYWKNHLGARHYHISALYVVDLVRFRQLAAGDRLRGQYQALSQDPNSLSNLDQDLPNNMIHQVPIKSLPQEWLWCETWCSDASKAVAKTIDLCNNPLTKEPKLTSAVRIIPEWTSYDQEIRAFQEEIMMDNKQAGYEKESTVTGVKHEHLEL